MRVLMWHCDSFKSEVTEKGRSPLREETFEPVIAVGECLLVYAASEKQDEPNPEMIIQKTAAEITKLARQLKVETMVIIPFAHLFVELASPATAMEMTQGLDLRLRSEGFRVFRTPFGWFNTLDIKAKGHPLSRVARQIRLENGSRASD